MIELQSILCFRSAEEWDVLICLGMRGVVWESWDLGGTRTSHQTSSSFHLRTDQLDPDDVCHAAIERKVTCFYEAAASTFFCQVMAVLMGWDGIMES